MKTIKRLAILIVIIAAMYITAKWPGKVVYVSETGYRAAKSAVSAVSSSIRQSSVSSESSRKGEEKVETIEGDEIRKGLTDDDISYLNVD